MLDRLLELVPGQSATGEKRVTASPGGFPRFLLVECIAQLAGIAAVSEEGEGGFLATIDHAEFSGDVLEGDTLIVSARIVKSFGRLCLVEGCVDADGRCLAEAQLTLGVGRL